MENILKIQSLTKTFSRKIKNLKGIEDIEEYSILNNFNIEVKKGKITALIGGNGTGKTTLFNIIGGYLPPEKGKILYYNTGKEINLLKYPPHKITSFGIGRMFQDNHIFSDMSILDNMLVAETNHYTQSVISSVFRRKKIKTKGLKDNNKVEKIFKELLGENNIFWEMRYKNAGSLSYGQQRILGLARLFMQDYSLLLLDEPTSGVNAEIIQQIEMIIKKFSQYSKTVLLIEHNLDFVNSVADICCYLDKGKIQISGTPKYVTENEAVIKSYIGIKN